MISLIYIRHLSPGTHNDINYKEGGTDAKKGSTLRLNSNPDGVQLLLGDLHHFQNAGTSAQL